MGQALFLMDLEEMLSEREKEKQKKWWFQVADTVLIMETESVKETGYATILYVSIT